MKKFLTLAALMAVLATLAFANAVFAAGSSTSTVTIDYTDSVDDFVVSGADFPAAFSLSPYVSNAAATATFADTLFLTVLDKTGNDVGENGHHLQIQFNEGAKWVYTGIDGAAGYGDVAIGTTATPGADEMSVKLTDDNGLFEGVSLVPSGCVPTMDPTNVTELYISDSARTFLVNEDICPGTYKYSLGDFLLTAPLDGLGVGSYVIDGTITAVDGQPL